MSTSSSRPEWSGDMLDRPEMVEAFAKQLRGVLGAQAEYVAKIRRDAEAMWKANPPEGYSTFEAWWRHRWVTSPFGQIEDHIEKAAKLTFDLEARYRRGRHEIPERKAAAALEKEQARETPAVTAGGAPIPPKPRTAPADTGSAGGDFLELVRKGRSA
ncbi:hypothetical protein [Streptomyces sp. NPDC101110]|uniref:Uncharacterized protein n=2 Tax=Streptomyces sp. F11 TaxID=319318 RepID=V9QG73_9ACTN|nr:hypothetical protein pFP12.9 [Streptomyces sp. F11]